MSRVSKIVIHVQDKAQTFTKTHVAVAYAPLSRNAEYALWKRNTSVFQAVIGKGTMPCLRKRSSDRHHRHDGFLSSHELQAHEPSNSQRKATSPKSRIPFLLLCLNGTRKHFLNSFVDAMPQKPISDLIRNELHKTLLKKAV